MLVLLTVLAGSALHVPLSAPARAPRQDRPQVLRRVASQAAGDAFGTALAAGRDLDGDGGPDVAVGAFRASGTGAAAGAVEAFRGSDGVRLWRRDAEEAGTWLGASLALTPDLDGDLCADVAVGAPYGAGGAGEVLLLSGRDGALLLRLVGSQGGGQFGSAVAALDDVDGDGWCDLAVGAPTDARGGLLAGRVEVRSGLDGRLLWAVDGAAGDLLGQHLCAADDLDGDGCEEVLVGAPLADDGGFNTGGARVYSGRDGVLRRTLGGSTTGDQLGDRVARVGDLDLDGVRDLALGAPGSDAGGIDSGAVEVRSGRDGSLLLIVPGDAPGAGLQTVVDVGDQDLDGTSDLALGAALGGEEQAGRVRVVSGGTGLTLFEFDGAQPGGWLGASLASAGELDGRGGTELWVGVPGSDDLPQRVGQALLLRGLVPRPDWNPRAAPSPAASGPVGRGGSPSRGER